jgi:hypothetical protein
VRALAVVALLALAAPARADTTDTFVAFGYVVPMGFAGIATAVNSTYLAYGEPAPRHWRWIGWLAGGIDVAWSVGLFAAANDRTEGLVLGGLALGVGAASILTATFVGEESRRVGVVPVAGRTGAGLALVGRF